LAQPNQLRIIGGQWRGRKIVFPPEPGVRPTPDRVRETLFNWLGQDLAGRATLDAYTGTGALSLESLSRGASRAVAVDRNPRLIHALEATAARLGTDALELHRADALGYLAGEPRRFDVVFLDPPFDDDPWPELLPLAARCVSPDGVIYAEARMRVMPEAALGLEVLRCDRAGQVHYHLLRHAS
jgi:16S rRNA (guanine(966)-N(2))-methyltransferase RsmD